MKTRILRSGFFVTAIALAIAAIWHERTAIRVWYTWRQLNRAEEKAFPAWRDRLAQFEEAALPRLVAALSHNDARGCGNARAVLVAIAQRLQPDAERRSRWLKDPIAAFPRFSARGQQEFVAFFLDLRAAGLLDESTPADVDVLTRLLEGIPSSPHPDVLARALTLVESLLAGSKPAEPTVAYREIVDSCLRHPAADVRCQAIRLTVRPAVDHREAVVPLLTDPDVEVRKVALLAVGASNEILATDDLLFWLHDPDAVIRRLCRQALQGRGLSDKQLNLGKLITDPRPAERLKVLDYLNDEPDSSPAVWLRRLSHDQAPAVRAAALRLAGQSPQLGLRDRLEQMSQNDPSPTVQQLASHYLRQQDKKNAAILSR